MARGDAVTYARRSKIPRSRPASCHRVSVDIDALRRAALVQAGIDVDDARPFQISDAKSATGEHAKTWRGRTQIDDPVDRAELGVHIAEANSEDGRNFLHLTGPFAR
jgi:hypothetical protein